MINLLTNFQQSRRICKTLIRRGGAVCRVGGFVWRAFNAVKLNLVYMLYADMAWKQSKFIVDMCDDDKILSLTKSNTQAIFLR